MSGGQKTKIAINGFGRIGRNAFKIAFERPDLEIVAVNDLTDTKTLAHLLKHDSNYGAYQHDVSSDEQHIIVKDQKIKVLSEKDPVKLPWKDLGVDVVIESTGLFTDPAKAKAHIEAGAKKVVISAPAEGDDAKTIVIGVNDDKLAEAGDIFSGASCTTVCITPVMAVLEASFGIEKALMTTMHGYTQDQRLQDAPHKDLRRARNAATNLVPTSTGATKAAAKALPALEAIFGGLSVRVPIPVVSLADFAVVTKRDVSVEEVNEAMKKAAAEPFYQGILDVTEEELVSSDFIGNSHSAIVDLKLTAVVGGNLVKVVAWYDNEWGYSNRLIELTADVGRLLQGGSQPEVHKEAKPDAGSKSAHHHHKDEKDADAKEEKGDIMEPPDEPLLSVPQSTSDEHDLLEKSVPSLETQGKEPLPAEDGDKSAVGEDTSGAGYIIDGEHQPNMEEDKNPETPTKRPLPPDATNIDGVHRF